MEVLKVELEGLTTSFRYPGALTGRQPSFPLPPPSTLYGHVSSALGYHPDPTSFQFAFTFTSAATFDNYEHTWILSEDPHKPKHGQPEFNTARKLSPTIREVLFRPHLTLYIRAQNLTPWEYAFRRPKYTVVLGRSQDLATYTSVQRLTLDERPTAYLDDTLLPWSWRTRVPGPQGLFMPRFIDPNNRLNVQHARYVALIGRTYFPAPGDPPHDPHLIRTAPGDGPYLVDPTSPEHRGRHRALIWHTLTDHPPQ